MIDLDNQTQLEIDLSKLENIAQSLSPNDVELIITDDTTMQTLNHTHRDKAQSTDVLSFPIDSSFLEEILQGMPLGSIIISENFVKDKANALGHSEQDELTLLFIHGMLHLLGFDHEVDEGQMREKEKNIIEQFDLPESLIIRTEEC